MRLVCSLLCTKGLTEVVQTSDRFRTLATETLCTAELWYPLDERALSGGDLSVVLYREISNQRKLPHSRVTIILQNMLYFLKTDSPLIYQGDAK